MTIVSYREAENRLPASKQRDPDTVLAGVFSHFRQVSVSFGWLSCLTELALSPSSQFTPYIISSDNRCAPKTDTQTDVNCMLNKRKQACVRLREAYLRIKCIPREGNFLNLV